MITASKTIAAISTPFGRGGIAVIRISGENAVGVASKMFFPASGKQLSDISPNRATYGIIVSDGQRIDDGIAVIYRAPSSYTGEDTVEISCHGGILLTERVLKTAFDNGAAPARAGEFTERAFLNGKLSLSEAEGVIGLIDAENEEKLRLSASHTSGVLSRRIDVIYNEILRLISSVYVSIDYPDEDLEPVGDEELISSLKKIEKDLKETADTYKRGKAVSEGVKTVLIGKPNTGKSSLLNALLGEDRAIVTDLPGTTRDVIEEKVSVGRIILRMADTAGIRKGAGVIEQIGIEKALKKANEAELIIGMFDVSDSICADDITVLEAIRGYIENGKSVICVLNKSDSVNKDALKGLNERIPDGCVRVETSAKTGEGIDALKNACESLFAEGETDYNQTAVIASARQYSAVSTALVAIRRALFACESGYASDVCGMDLESALSSLGEVDGRSVAEEVTSEIFKNFCVGK